MNLTQVYNYGEKVCVCSVYVGHKHLGVPFATFQQCDLVHLGSPS